MQAMKKHRPKDLHIKGVGGIKMAAVGVSSSINTAPLAVFGLVDGIKVYGKARKLIRETVELIIAEKPDVVVLIDSWGFTIRVAKQLRKYLPNTILVKYVGPQVFALRPGRARTTAIWYDHLFTIHSFDRHFFESESLQTTLVGNPALFSKPTNANNQFIQIYNPKNKPILGVFFGSRPSEIKQITKPFLDALDVLKFEFPDLLVVAPLSDNIATLVRSLAIEDHRLQDIVLLEERTKHEVISHSKIALACSGTITLELAAAGVPTVVGYRIGGWFVDILRKILVKAKFISLINLAADEEIFPEFINDQCTGKNLGASLIEILSDAELQIKIKQKLATTVMKMRGSSGNPSQIAAAKTLYLLDQRSETST